jgi:hypothetical protein
MRVLIALDLSDTDLAEAYGTADLTDPAAQDDLILSLAARLEEAGYFGTLSTPVAGRVLAVGDITGDGTIEGLLDAAEVGADGLDQSTGGHILGTIADLRQQIGH